MVFDFILISGFALINFINVFLYKKKTQSSRFLILIFSFVGIHLLNEYASIHKHDLLLYLTDIISEGSGYIIGPFILHYVLSLLKPLGIRQLSFLKWYIPYVLHFFFVTIPVLHEGFGITSLVSYSNWITTYWEQFYVVESLYFVLMVLIALKSIIQFEPRIKAFYSNISDKNLVWAKQMLLCLMAYQVINLSISAWILLVSPLDFEEDYLLTLNIIIICFYLGYNGVFQTRIFLPEFLIEEDLVERIEGESEGLAGSDLVDSSEGSLGDELELEFVDDSDFGLDIKSVESTVGSSRDELILSEKIKRCLEDDKIYLNENLNLRDMAEAISVKEKELSTYINQELNSSFYELINHYRVEAFKSEVKSNAHLTIMGVANACGFKSKTSFYRIFKKATGQTPAQYLKSTKE